MILPPEKRPSRKLVRLPRSKVRPDPNQPRKHFDQDKLLELAASLRANGQVVPAIVRVLPEDPDFFTILDGHRRWLALGMVPCDEIEAVVVEGNISEDEVEDIQLSVGLTNQQLNPLEAGAKIVRRMEREKLSAAQMAEKIGVGEGTLCKYVTIFKQIASQLQDEVRSGTIPFTIAYQLSRLKDKPERQVQIAESWKNNIINRKGVTDAVNKELGNGRKGAQEPPVEVVDGEATARFPAGWTWDQIAQWFSKVVEAAKRGAKMPGAPTAYLQGLLKSA